VDPSAILEVVENRKISCLIPGSETRIVQSEAWPIYQLRYCQFY